MKKLTAEKVIDIRTRAEKGQRGIHLVLAAEHGITPAAVSLVVNRRIWKKVKTGECYEVGSSNANDVAK